MAIVHLIDFTGKGRPDEAWHAAHMLMFTKATRLELSPGLLDAIAAQSEAEKHEQLRYMANTIPSSWEFVDLTFLIEGVTRAVAQQMTRTRTASYAMQSQRVTDASKMAVLNPFTLPPLREREPTVQERRKHKTFTEVVQLVQDAYGDLIEDGASAEDARGILPMNTTCNLIAKYNLRSLVDVLKARRSLRAQGEYADIAAQMEARVLYVWPWAAPFFADKHAAAIEILERTAREIGITTGKGAGWEIAKAIDMLRKD